MQLVKIAKNQDKYLQKIRRELHSIPEVRFKTTQTRGVIVREIQKIFNAIPYTSVILTKMEVKKGGIWADIIFNNDWPLIVFFGLVLI